jgi:predicted phage tail protein
MTTVILHGALAGAVGKDSWKVDIATPLEAVSAVDANCGGKLLQHLYQNLDTEYRVVVDNGDLTHVEEFTVLERPMNEIHIMPAIRGSGGSGGWLVLVGIVIIALVIATGGVAIVGGDALLGTAASVTVTSTGSFFLTIGLAVTLSGLSQVLAPNQKTDNKEKPENKPSYIFNGAVNTYQQGNPIPWGAGFVRTGSQVVSAGIRSVDISMSDL